MGKLGIPWRVPESVSDIASSAAPKGLKTEKGHKIPGLAPVASAILQPASAGASLHPASAGV
jgi:hypothetical protein